MKKENRVIFDWAIKALAEAKCPDFAGFDKNAVLAAFDSAFQGFAMDIEWFYWFREEILRESSNEAVLRITDSSSFSPKIKGPAAYLALVKGNKQIRLTVGPYSVPIVFDGEEEAEDKKSLFLCPGDCEECGLSSKECPDKGQFTSEV